MIKFKYHIRRVGRLYPSDLDLRIHSLFCILYFLFVELGVLINGFYISVLVIYLSCNIALSELPLH